MMKAGLVLTSIFDPVCLEDYFDNFQHFGHLEQVKVFMVADVKTPLSAYKRCAALRERGMDISCLHYSDTANFLNAIGLKPEMFPLNSDSRRNIGYLQALAAGVDFVISIDDDNFVESPKRVMRVRDVSDDYFDEHTRCCGMESLASIGINNWYNPCDMLVTEQAIFQRGFPYYMRQTYGGKRTLVGRDDLSGAFSIHANQGLWYSHPDMDAMSWLATPTRVTEIDIHGSCVLGPKVWSPINSQNTAIRAEAIPAYFFIPSWKYNGLPADRFGDIFQGYFLQKCMKHLGGHLRVGTPIVDHKRNTHAYFADLEKELPCIMLLEEMLPWLTDEGTKLSGSDYCEAYECLAEMLREWCLRPNQEKKFTLTVGFSAIGLYEKMRAWAKACRTIGVGKVAAA